MPTITLPSSRVMRLNIWRTMLLASHQEIHEGMHFYEGAYGLCKMLARIYNLSTSHIAGMYAALSPLNVWDTNVSNIIDVLRWNDTNQPVSSLKVNTTNPNRDKAISIARGRHPEGVLKGKKVRAFYRAICDPSDNQHYPIDRHLINLAMGTKITSNKELSHIVGSEQLYSKVEQAYMSLGNREQIGNRLASIAWFVQRRTNNNHNLLDVGDNRLVCCDQPMWSHSKNRFYFYMGRDINGRFTKTNVPTFEVQYNERVGQHVDDGCLTEVPF